MNKLYVIPVVILVLAVPAYLFLFDEGYCPEIEEMEESNIQIIGDSVFGSGAEGCTDISGFMSLASVSYTTSDAADDTLRVDLGGRRVIKKKKVYY